MINFKNNVQKPFQISQNLFMFKRQGVSFQKSLRVQSKRLFCQSKISSLNFLNSESLFDRNLRTSSRPLLSPSFFKFRNGRPDFLNKMKALRDTSKDFEGLVLKNPQTRSDQRTGFLKRTFASIYYLLIAYKKTFYIRWGSYFNNSTNLHFILAFSPFIAYFIQTSMNKYDLNSQQNTFLQKSLPGLRKPIQNITWETFAYTKYAKQLELNSITELISVDDGLFISLNPSWKFKQKQTLTATLESGSDSQKAFSSQWSFLPSRYFYQLLSEATKPEFNPILSGSKTKTSQRLIGSPWQIFFNELDDIPTKLNSIFPAVNGGHTLSAYLDESLVTSPDAFQTTIKLPNSSFDSSLTLKDEQIRASGLDSLTHFKNLFNLLTSNYLNSTNKDFFLRGQTIDRLVFKNNLYSPVVERETSLINRTSQLTQFQFSFKKIQSNQSNTLTKPWNGETRAKVVGISKSSLLSIQTQSSSLNSNRQPRDVAPRISEFQKVGSIKLSDQTWIRSLMELLASRLQVSKSEGIPPALEMRLERTFQYNIDSGFTHLGELIKKTISRKETKNLTETERNLYKIWQKKLRLGLRTPFPVWVKELQNQTYLSNPNRFINVEQPLVQLGNPRGIFKTNGSMDPVLSEVLAKNPKYLLKLLKKPLAIQTNLFVKRKVTGYLYPDSFRETLLKNNCQSNFNFQRSQPFSAFFSSKLKDNPSILKEKVQSSLTFEKINPVSLIHISQPFQKKIELLTKNDLFINPADPENKLGLQPNSDLPDQLRANFAGPLQDVDLARNLNSIKSVPLFPALRMSWNPQKNFFGTPGKSPTYGLTLETFQKKTKSLQPKSPRTSIPRTYYVKPYKSSFPFLNSQKNLTEIIKANTFSETRLDNYFFSTGQNSEPVFRPSAFEEFPLPSPKVSPISYEKDLSKVGKVKSFLNSQVGFHSLEPQFPVLKPLFFQKVEKAFDVFDRSVTVSYKVQPRYTKLKVFSTKVASALDSMNRPSRSTRLYESIGFKSWAILSQLGFIYIFFKLSDILRREYIEEILDYIADFYAFLNEYDKQILEIFIQVDNVRVIKKTTKKFKDLVGGRFLLTEFGEAILLLRNSQKSFSKIEISKPQPPLSNPFFKQVPSQTSKAINLSLNSTDAFQSNLKESILKLPALSIFGGLVNISQQNFNKKNLIEKLDEPDSFINFIPKGVLLVGPPGTGKTLVVKAFAGEALVPVIVESGKMLTSDKKTNGSERLQDLFKTARELSPCILFFDEIDRLGQKRENSLSTTEIPKTKTKIPNPLNRIYSQNLKKASQVSKSNMTEIFSGLNWDVLNPVVQLQIPKTQGTQDLKLQINKQKKGTIENQNQNLILLNYLLYELDGLNKGRNVIVIGATNRPGALDSALTRPGRFGKIIYLDLPGKQKRFDLLQFYSKTKTELANLSSIPKKTKSVERPKPPQETRRFLTFLPDGDFKRAIEVQPFFTAMKKKMSALLILKKNAFSTNYGLETLPAQNTEAAKAQWKPTFGTFVQKSGKKIEKILARDYRFGLKALSKTQFKLSNLGILQKGPRSLEVESTIDWNYLAIQTAGLSSAHLSAAMNRSALKALDDYFSRIQSRRIQSKSLSEFFSTTLVFLNEPVSQKTVSPEKSLETLPSFFSSKFTEEIFDKFYQGSLVIKFSKELKLRLIVQSRVATPKIVDQLFSKNLTFSQNFLESTSSQKVLGKKKGPLHTFETIEYGIQTISSSNTNLQLRRLKGNEINQKIMGQPSLNDFLTHLPFPRSDKDSKALSLEYTSTQHFVQSKEKNGVLDKLRVAKTGQLRHGPVTKLRTRFYQKHRQYLRTLTLMETSSILNSGFSKDCLAVRIIALGIQFKTLNRYINRLTQNHSFGWLLLSNSTCLIKNPFFNFAVQKATTKKLSGLYYSLLSLKELSVKQVSPTFLKWQTLNTESQNDLFGDFLFLNRSAYYLSGKSLIRFYNLSKQNKDQIQSPELPDQPISLWTFIRPSQTQSPKLSSRSANSFLTKIQFNDLLLTLIAGKATETLMLANQFEDRKAESTIGISDLKEYRSLIRLMKEDYFVDLAKPLTLKQMTINLVDQKNQISQKEELLFLKELATELESQPQTKTKFIGNQTLKRKPADQFTIFEQPWWQLKSRHLIASSDLKYGKWSRLFVLKEQQTFRNIEWVAPDSYFHTQLNNAQLASTVNKDRSLPLRQWTNLAVTNKLSIPEGLPQGIPTLEINLQTLSNDKAGEQNNDSKTNFESVAFLKTNPFINSEFVSKYVEFSKLNWNQKLVANSESTTKYFVFEAFNKVFSRLETNREFLDLLVYSLFCYENLRPFEVLNFYRRFYKENK